MSKNLLKHPIILGQMKGFHGADNTAIFQENGQTYVIKTAHMAPERGAQLEAQYPGFSCSLKDKLRGMGVVSDMQAASSVTTGENGQQVMTHAICVVFPSHSDPQKEAFIRGMVEGAMGEAMNARGYDVSKMAGFKPHNSHVDAISACLATLNRER